MKLIRLLREGDGDPLYDMDPGTSMSDALAFIRSAKAQGYREKEAIELLHQQRNQGKGPKQMLPFTVHVVIQDRDYSSHESYNAHAVSHARAINNIRWKEGLRHADDIYATLEDKVFKPV